MKDHRALKNSGSKNSRRLRILLVTPEISFIPRNMGKIATILQDSALPAHFQAGYQANEPARFALLLPQLFGSRKGR